MPTGKSFCGFLHSSAAVARASNPIYAKNITKAPVKIPSNPFGANGVQLRLRDEGKLVIYHFFTPQNRNFGDCKPENIII